MPPPCFWQKRPQATENKGSEREKERQEKTRGCKLLKTQSEPIRENWNAEGPLSVREAAQENTGGNADVYENKCVAEKAIRKTMKTKGEQSDVRCGHRAEATNE
jgi:hypothetical protein